MRRLNCRQKKTFLVTMVICVTVVRVLVLSLQCDEEPTYEDMFKSRHSKQTSSSPHRHLDDSANEKEGTGRKLQGGYVEGDHHTRSKSNKGAESNIFRPKNQIWRKIKNDVQSRGYGTRNQKDSAKDKHHESKDLKYGKTMEELDREDFAAVTTDSSDRFTTDDKVVNGSKRSYSLTTPIMQAGLLRVAYVENRHGSYRHSFEELRDSRRCPCGLGKNRSDVSVTSEEYASNLGDYDVLIFAQDIGQKPFTLPVWRNIVSSAKEGQRRVYASTESISKVRYLLSSVPIFNGPFHWSLTYHSKSDITIPYGCYQPFEYVQETENRDKNWAEGKTGLVAWMSSGKNAMWKRDEFVKSLQAYFQVDLYEKCQRDSDSCMVKMKKYKFYLAIEDSCCSEYITEKLWSSFAWGAVPIVVGAPKEDYLRVAPPNSFIYADDFETPEDLGDYLRKLDNTDEFYNDYFKWRQEGEIFFDSSLEEAQEEKRQGLQIHPSTPARWCVEWLQSTSTKSQLKRNNTLEVILTLEHHGGGNHVRHVAAKHGSINLVDIMSNDPPGNKIVSHHS